ncbi:MULTISPECIES: helix-turn-helix domain-containing protein [Pseudooceanicola]|uniref:helix-turn-helix domain-containing protein n=1 Tax=Pseudooceanicola TaxID=1679449 RepID=UPI001EEFBEF3|nr:MULTISPECIES: LysR family transcriptional regulator [Pseudooceanicola]
MPYSKAITVRQMEVLNAVAAAGSMRQAAKLLGVSQPTISAQLAKLEEAVGAELVHRDRQRLDVLTAAGELWARTARAVLFELEGGRIATRSYSASIATVSALRPWPRIRAPW